MLEFYRAGAELLAADARCGRRAVVARRLFARVPYERLTVREVMQGTPESTGPR